MKRMLGLKFLSLLMLWMVIVIVLCLYKYDTLLKIENQFFNTNNEEEEPRFDDSIFDILYEGDVMDAKKENTNKVEKLSTVKRDKLFSTRKPKLTPTIDSRKVLLAVGVISGLPMLKRREVIRLTWFRQCKQNPHIVQCRFFLDDITDAGYDGYLLQRERDVHQDMLFMPIKSGYRFAERYIWMVRWYLVSYDFDYFLRIDDDYFLCMNRLLMELPYRPKHGLLWGWLHCCCPNVVRIDEGWILLSRDIIIEALTKYSTTLLCHPWADIAIQFWLKDSKLNITWFPDNDRIMHHKTSLDYEKYMNSDLCQTYIGLHGTYEKEMLKYWIASGSQVLPLHMKDDKVVPAGNQALDFHNNIQDNKNRLMYTISIMPNLRDVCHEDLEFKWQDMPDGFIYEPKLCKDKPTWLNSNHTHLGRER